MKSLLTQLKSLFRDVKWHLRKGNVVSQAQKKGMHRLGYIPFPTLEGSAVVNGFQ